jgi:hypothetical protein
VEKIKRFLFLFSKSFFIMNLKRAPDLTRPPGEGRLGGKVEGEENNI